MTTATSQIKLNLLEMMTTRGYQNKTPEEGAEDTRGHPLMWFEKERENDEPHRVVVFFDVNRCNMQILKSIFVYMTRNTYDSAILIYNESITSMARKLIQSTDTYCKIELFSYKEMSYNPIKHVLVPRHSLASEHEITQIKQSKIKIPLLLTTDPIARYYNWSKGTYVKINRRDGTIAYRVVRAG